MRGNSHVRFLKGKAGVAPLTYLIRNNKHDLFSERENQFGTSYRV
jgi:hypothetical protein